MTPPGDGRIRILFDAHQLGSHQAGNETYVRGMLASFFYSAARRSFWTLDIAEAHRPVSQEA